MTRLTPTGHFVPSPSSFATGLFMKSILTVILCAACVQAQDSQQSSSDESWTKTTENAIGNGSPSRTTESHTKSGNRSLDKQRIEVLGPNGRYQPFTEAETETIQVDATTTRTVVRTYQWNGNGQRVLTQVTEENARFTAGGDLRTERKTSSADVNGNFQVVQREVSDTRKLSSGAEETKSTVYRADGYGGFTQVGQTEELKTRGADDSVAVKKTTLTPDGNGRWRVNGVTEKTIKDDGKNRTTEERISTPDLDGRLHENSRTVEKEAENASGEKRSIVETYDGATQLNRRVSKTQKKDSSGETTEEQIERVNLATPSDGAKVTGRTKYVVQYAGPGTRQSKTVELRDVNGAFNVTTSDTQKSTQPPTPPPAKSEAPAPQKSEAPKP